MIAEFPHFSPLQVGDRPRVQQLTKAYAPYSDFNFTSLYSWDTREAVRVSVLNENLVVRFTDYTTGEPFYSFLGANDVDDTTKRLLALAKSEGVAEELRLVPEVSAGKACPNAFEAAQDGDNFDYILSVDRLKSYHGNKLGPKRNFVNRFNKEYEAKTAIIDLSDVGVQTRFLDMFHRWLVAKGERADNAENELLALHRVMFAARSIPELFTVATFVEGDLAGFSINEILPNGFAMIHFEKADSSYVGVYAHLMQQMAVLLGERGCQYINYEQDLGVFGLRRGKRSYVPSSFLRKYTLRSASQEQTTRLKSEEVLASFLREGCPIDLGDAEMFAPGHPSTFPRAVPASPSMPPAAHRPAGQTVYPPRSVAPLELSPLSRSRGDAARLPSGEWLKLGETRSVTQRPSTPPSSSPGSLRPTPFILHDPWLPVPVSQTSVPRAPTSGTQAVPAAVRVERRRVHTPLPREEPGEPTEMRVERIHTLRDASRASRVA